MSLFKTSVAAALLTSAVPAVAQTTQRAETIVPARLSVLDKCPFTKPTITPSEEAFFAAVLAPFLAGLAGDAAKAGVTALAGALEEASRERAIGARGIATFDFYEQLVSNEAYVFRSRLRPSGANCLVMSVDQPSPATLTAADLPAVNDLVELGREGVLQSLANAGVTTIPGLYLEAELVSQNDGFVVQPVLIWYPTPLKGASRKGGMPSELHVTFATPDATKLDGGIGAPFAAARIVLPAIAAKGSAGNGGVYGRTDLKNIGSALMPKRPETGLAATRKTAATAAFTALATTKREVADLEEQIVNPARYGLTAAQVKPLKVQKATKDYQIPKLKVAADAAGKAQKFGGTTVEARFVQIKNANKFGLAIATALQTRSAALGQAITQELTPQPAWSDAETNYISGMLTVRQKQAAYDAVLPGGDATAILNAEVELKNAQAQANAKAVAAGKAIPFPAIL